MRINVKQLEICPQRKVSTKTKTIVLREMSSSSIILACTIFRRQTEKTAKESSKEEDSNFNGNFFARVCS